ncbi:MAG: hypothetical protein K8I30_13590 [Anaerolineae bacterium]|nr:hypothetical protein [Anaerolineae bacterium]
MKRMMGILVLILSVSGMVSAQDTISQWATDATASSQYGKDEWSAMQATGRPDTESCGDKPTAWASETATGEDTIELTYDRAVIPTQVNIYQTYNPGSITRVELVNRDTGLVLKVSKSNDKPGKTDCPGVFSLNIDGAEEPVNGVVIYVDQSIGGDWNEIDAVELVGIPTESSGNANLNTNASGDAAPGISVECPEGFSFDNGVETVINMRSGFNYTATAIGIDGFDPIIAVTDGKTTLCNDDDANAAGYVVGVPTTGDVAASRASSQMPFSYNGNDTFGDISIIVGSVDNTPGEFVLVIEGLAVTTADGSGDGAGDPFTTHITPNMQASGVPVSAYMISVTDGLDSFLYLVDQDNHSIELSDGSYYSCDDAGTDTCFGQSANMATSYVSRENGRVLGGGDYDAMLALTWDDLGVNPGDEAYVNWRLTSSGLRTFGDYVVVFHLGTANEFGG